MDKKLKNLLASALDDAIENVRECFKFAEEDEIEELEKELREYEWAEEELKKL